MKTLPCLPIVAALMAAAAPSVRADIERTVEKTFTVQPGGSLHVETSGGNIRVESSGDSVVKVVATEKFRTSSEADADEIEKKLTLALEQTGNEVSATAKYERQPMGFHFGSWPPVQVSFLVTVPASFAAELKTSGGNIAAGDLNGKVNARTSGGNIKLGKIGGEIDASTSGGNVSLDEGGAAVKLRTSGGNIAVGRAVGATDLETSGGDIKIESVENALHAGTSGGNVRAGIAGSLKDDCELRTSGGQVTATVAKDAKFRLDASTSGGGVHADGLTITLESGGSGKSHLSGSVNGGGPMLKLRSSGGDIRIKAQ